MIGTVKPNVDDLDFLTSKMLEYTGQSRAQSTIKKYKKLFSDFEFFCQARNLTSIPASPINVALFLTKLMYEKKTHNVIIPSVYAIKYFNELKGHSLSIKEPYIKNMMEAAKRSAKGRNLNRKDPISREQIIKICQHFTNSNRLADLRDLAMMVVSFGGFLRFDELVNLRTSHIKFFDDYLELRLDKSKTDQYRDGNVVLLAKGSTVACPLLRLRQYLEKANISPNRDQFLFRPIYASKNGQNLIKKDRKLSYTRARESIMDKINSVEGVSLNFGLHSFRSGGATEAAAAGVSHAAIKRHGRWRSDASKERYVAEGIKRRLQVSRSLEL